jgi:hypothetical protein
MTTIPSRRVCISHAADTRADAEQLEQLLRRENVAVARGSFDPPAQTILLLSPGWLESEWPQIQRHVASSSIDSLDLVARLLLLRPDSETPVPPLLRPMIEPSRRFLSPTGQRLDAAAVVRYLLHSPGSIRPAASHLRQVFVLGHPGAGKSAFCALLEKQLEARGCPSSRIDLYRYLQVLFRCDALQGNAARFAPDPDCEFTITDATMFDRSLHVMAGHLHAREAAADGIDIVELSFAHGPALTELLRSFPHSAIVHVDSSVDVCEARNASRGERLRQSLADANTSSEGFDRDPDLHYVPPDFYQNYRAAGMAMPPQLRYTAPLYFHIENHGDDLAAYHTDCVRLAEDELLPRAGVGDKITP